MSGTKVFTDTPPFWRRFGFFIAYIRQEHLYFQITLLALANILLLFPSLIISLIVSMTLFLASYKLAFEVLSSVSRGEFQYRDSFSFQITEIIGLKALSLPVLQLLIYIYVFRYEPTLGFVLLIFTTLLTPAFLMLLADSQSITVALNPFKQVQIVSRIGSEYYLLTGFLILAGIVNLLLRYLFIELLPGMIAELILAWVLYFLLIYSFAIVGYVMYRHADELGYETLDSEAEQASEDSTDPMATRIEQLLAAGEGLQAKAIIDELIATENRHDLSQYIPEAEHLVVQQKRQPPAKQLSRLVTEKNFRAAMRLMDDYYQDGHLIKPADGEILNQLMTYNAQRKEYEWLNRLFQHHARCFSKDHQAIVDNGFLVSQTLYAQGNKVACQKLLTKLIDGYQKTTNVQKLSSYLIGLKKMSSKP